MKNQLQASQEQWYLNLIDECKSIITEAVFTSRWALVEGYHQFGKRILEDEDKFTEAGYLKDDISSCMTTSLGMSQRTIERALQFVRTYPDLDKVPEGKNLK